MVVKSYEGIKPFKENGVGHKDYIIWETIRRYVEGNAASPPNYFLVNNSKDFCADDRDNMVLHPTLATQITDESQRPKVYPSIKRLYDEVVAPALENLSPEEIPNLGVQDIESIVNDILEEELAGYIAYGFEGVPFSNEVYASLAGEATINDREFKRIDDEVVITITGTVPIEVEGYMEKHAYYAEGSDLDIDVSDPDWNDWVMAVSKTVETAFELLLSYSVEEKKISGHSLTLPQEIEDDFYK